MSQAVAVGNYLLQRAEAARAAGFSGWPAFTPMKLQKLAFYAHGWQLGLSGAPIVADEQVEAWEWGPVFPSLYHASKQFGNRPIAAPLRVEDWRRGPAFDGPNHTPTLESEFADPAAIRARLDRTLDLYGAYTATQLSNSTHDIGTPWHDVYVKLYGSHPPHGTDIESARIERFFREWSRLGRPPTNLPLHLDGIDPANSF